MTGSPYELTPEAEADIDQILGYLVERSPEAARTVYGAFFEAFERLAERPGIGHARQDLTERPVKFWAVFSYLVVYDPDSKPIRILTVLHGARDVRALLEEG